ncbi:hypothetical protein P43SY_007843 [Pythium insidiosum]|uniref:Nuclear migration protein nudC n=1 Tax=Pythium insidiosum TaxID=114742 RepID=A0AAD5QBM7_PYTIN|nr:hypothetical protein P43SY_007843 [Pythium insidiosum]
MADDERFDGLLLNMAQSQRGIEPMLDTVFSFLRRKTDFFTGASPQVVEETVLKALRKQAAFAEKDLYHKKQQEVEKQKLREKKQAEEALKKKKQEEAAAAQKKNQKVVEPEPSPRFEEVTDEEAAKITNDATKKTAGDATADEEDEGPPLVGNGGATEKYVWTQTLQEAQANFIVPEGTKSRQIAVDITSTRLKVGLKGASPIVDGLLHKRVKVDDSFWTLEDGNRICVYLQKENQMEWWKTIIQGDAEIDTKKVQPENSKLTDLDADTRQTVEKMMFDQRQKALGLPTSDDIQKQEILQKFMAQHPEMDFSKAKVT